MEIKTPPTDRELEDALQVIRAFFADTPGVSLLNAKAAEAIVNAYIRERERQVAEVARQMKDQQ